MVRNNRNPRGKIQLNIDEFRIVALNKTPFEQNTIFQIDKCSYNASRLIFAVCIVPVYVYARIRKSVEYLIVKTAHDVTRERWFNRVLSRLHRSASHLILVLAPLQWQTLETFVFGFKNNYCAPWIPSPLLRTSGCLKIGFLYYLILSMYGVVGRVWLVRIILGNNYC